MINAADPVRAEVGQLLPNDDELWSTTSLRNSKVVCLDWSAIGLEARDTSFDQVRGDRCCGYQCWLTPALVS